MTYPSELDRHIGQKVRFFRESADWTQEMLASAVGITFQQVQKYELGFHRVPASRLFLISYALNVDVRAFFPGGASGTQADWREQMFGWWKELRKRQRLVAQDASDLIARFGDSAYEEARERARADRLNTVVDENRPRGHWNQVRREIGRITEGNRVGLKETE